MSHPGSLDIDWQLRLAAFAELRRAAAARGGVVTADDLDAGFEHQGQRIRLWDARRGIWRPRQLGRDGAALTLVTTPPRPGRTPPYDDQVGSEADYFLYRYEGTDPEHWTNAAVRRAYLERRPLIYLYGIVPGSYLPVFPCSVVADDPASLAFHLMADSGARLVGPEMMAFGVTPERQYATAAVKVRLHQRRFRELVVSAYQVTCAMCRLRHGELLDGAHFLTDRTLTSRAGKIHHAAYDTNIVGVDPDCRVHVRQDVLDEHDGPMLRHGLQELHDEFIIRPRVRALWPKQEYLEERFVMFKAA